MRTTFTLEPDVAAEADRLRRSEGLGISEAVNRLIRAGLARQQASPPYIHRSSDVGLRVDVTNVGAVLELLDSN